MTYTGGSTFTLNKTTVFMPGEAVFWINNNEFAINYIVMAFEFINTMMLEKESDVEQFITKLGEFAGDDCYVFHATLITLKTPAFGLSEQDVIMTAAVLHYISSCFVDEDKELFLRENMYTDNENYLKMRNGFLTFSTNMLACYKEKLAHLTRLANVIKRLQQ